MPSDSTILDSPVSITQMHIIPVKSLIATAWTLTGVDILLTGGRIYIHWRKIRKIRLDDIFNVIALLFLLGFMITWQRSVPFALETVYYEMGFSSKVPTPIDPIVLKGDSSAMLVMYWCLKYSVKASFLALYWYIFDLSNCFRVVWASLTVYTALSFPVTLLAIFWHCGTPDKFMDLESCERNKPRAITILYMSSVLNIVGNLILLLVPIIMIRKLYIKTSEKVGLGIIFALAILDVAFEILRVVFSVSFALTKYPDRNLLWATLDPLISVMVCALPCYRGVLTRGWVRTAVDNLSYDSSKFKGWFMVSINSQGEPVMGNQVEAKEDVETGRTFSG